MHASIKLDRPIEFIDIDPNFKNPLISKCIIKVCYVGDEPNRNKSIITKNTAKGDLAQSVRGAMIVGFYNEEKKDFEEHNRMIDISNGMNFEDMLDIKYVHITESQFIDNEILTPVWLTNPKYSSGKTLCLDTKNKIKKLL